MPAGFFGCGACVPVSVVIRSPHVRNASGSGALQPQGRVLEALPQKRARF